MRNEPTNEDKQRVWDLYNAGCPERVPVVLTTNNRVYILEPRLNRDGITYGDIFHNAETMLLAQLRWQQLLRSYYHRFCDYPLGLPDKWEVQVHFQNVYEAWYFGCEVRFQPGQVPDTVPQYAGDNKWAIFEVDIAHPLEHDPYRRGVEFTERMMEMVYGYEFEGRPVEVLPYLNVVSDGPFTVALNVRGSEFLLDLSLDPDYADRLMSFITEASIYRARALLKYWGKELTGPLWLADDGILMISPEMYADRVLRHHRHFYDSLDPEGRLPRLMHLCGDASHHFPAIVQGCGVSSLDTGFPVDLGVLRKAIGPKVEIWGGPEVPLLLHGTPEQVTRRTREILSSGVLEGRRFILREANNLPPGVPEANLIAMYYAGLEYGRYI